MKKFIIGILLCLITSICHADVFTVDSLVSADDLTIEWLNGFKNTVIDALNSFPGENIQSGTITSSSLDNNANPEYRWGEAFNEFVYTGLLAPTATGLASTTTAGTAYIKEDSSLKMKRVVKDATAHTYTASKDTYVDLSSSGTYTYSEVTLGAVAPTVAANSIRLFKVITNATDVTTVTDLRILNVQVATNEDYDIKGCELYWSSITNVSVDAGIYYHGSTRIKKTTATVLNVSTASDYITGISERATSDLIYIYGDSEGNIKLDNNSPDYVDTSGNTVGIKRYYLYNSEYWRLIGVIYLNSTGSGNIELFSQSADWMFYDEAYNDNATTRVLNNGSQTVFTDVDCSSLVPVSAKEIEMIIYTSASINVFWKPKSSIAGTGVKLEANNATLGNVKLLLDDNRVGRYKVSANSVYMYIYGYRMGWRN